VRGRFDFVARQAAALVRKRRRLVARAQPALEQSLGAQFEVLFDAYAREQPLHSVGSRADALRFARWLVSERVALRRWPPFRRRRAP
jgi:hypothetical protein